MNWLGSLTRKLSALKRAGDGRADGFTRLRGMPALRDLPETTVTMLTDGLLLRLAKGGFLRLLKEPCLCWTVPGFTSATATTRG